MTPPTIRKVTAFITCDDHLLVFRKPFHPGTGTQLPAGTVEPGEPPEIAVLREAEEETGHSGYAVRALLTHRLDDMRVYGRDELHDRWSFHLTAPAGLPATWRHGESDPSSGPDSYIAFDFFWIPLAEAAGHLRAENHPALQHLR
ncbi:NUDIX hydrolase [Kribbella sp. ALI-6-A]|uniref:NUDIX hydrolase n=1 Tax=Kribbella sp. ALI-6-A TaxID=1933817 RepID=UPI00143D7050|nr:NUDIX domain-containing protein [Kribbella sp. ALI-6-A]